MRVLVGLMCALALLTVHTPPSAAATPALRNALRGLVDGGFPGAIGYVRQGWRVEREAAGLADRETGERATPTHRFRIASNTKAFTAAVVLQAVGANGLDEPVARWLPGVLPDETITVRQLLNHTSGLYDPTDERAFWKPYLDDHDWGHVYRPRDIVATAAAHPLTVQPGSGHDYSNTNYLVAGMLIEAVTGHPADAEVYRRIIRPLGLSQTTFPTTDPHLPGPHLHGYNLAGDDVSVFSPSYDWTAGAIVSTVDDLAEFHRALFDGTLLAPAELAELKHTVPVAPGVAYGLGVERMDLQCPDGTVVPTWGDTGAGPGYSSFSLVTEDTSRQLVLAMSTFDIADELAGGSGTPAATPLPTLHATFC